MAMEVTEQEVRTIIFKMKANLEYTINLEYLPLQREMGAAEKSGDVKRYMELENQIAPLRNQIAEEYDRLLLIKRRYNEMF